MAIKGLSEEVVVFGDGSSCTYLSVFLVLHMNSMAFVHIRSNIVYMCILFLSVAMLTPFGCNISSGGKDASSNQLLLCKQIPLLYPYCDP